MSQTTLNFLYTNTKILTILLVKNFEVFFFNLKFPFSARFYNTHVSRKLAACCLLSKNQRRRFPTNFFCVWAISKNQTKTKFSNQVNHDEKTVRKHIILIAREENASCVFVERHLHETQVILAQRSLDPLCQAPYQLAKQNTCLFAKLCFV